MNSLFKVGLSFAVGALAGATASYFYQKKKYDERLTSIVKEFSSIPDEPENDIPEESEESKPEEKPVQQPKPVNKPLSKEAKKLVKEYLPEEEDEEVANEIDEIRPATYMPTDYTSYSKDLDEIIGMNEEPEIIDEDDYHCPQFPMFSKIDLTLYSDNYLADDNMNVYNDIVGTIGEEAVEEVLKDVEGAEVFVLNKRLRSYFIVYGTHGRYMEAAGY